MQMKNKLTKQNKMEQFIKIIKFKCEKKWKWKQRIKNINSKYLNVKSRKQRVVDGTIKTKRKKAFWSTRLSTEKNFQSLIIDAL